MSIFFAVVLYCSVSAKAYEVHPNFILLDDVLDNPEQWEWISKDFIERAVIETADGLNVNCQRIIFRISNNLPNANREFNDLINEKMNQEMARLFPKRGTVMLDEGLSTGKAIMLSGDNLSNQLQVRVEIMEKFFNIEATFLKFSYSRSTVFPRDIYRVTWSDGVENAPHHGNIRLVLEVLWLILDDFNEGISFREYRCLY